MIERYEWCNQFIQWKSIVDIPCGCGWGTSKLRGYRECHGLDKDIESVKYAEKNYAVPYKLRFFVEDMQTVKVCLSIPVEVVICLEGFEHVSMEIGLEFLKQVRNILVTKGLLLMTVPVRDKEGKHSGNPHHVNEMHEQDFIHMIVEQFRVLSLEYKQMADGPVYYCVLQRR